MFKKNTAVVGFPIGHFINASTGAAVTTGTPTCKRMLDGTGAACANAASYNTDAAQWEIDLDAADTNGDMVGLSFTLTDCLPISFSFRTTTKLTSDLNDLSAAQVNAEADTALSDVGVTSTVTGRIDAAISTRSTLAAGAAMTLTSGERTALAAALEAAIIDELDGAAVMQAIADLIASDMTTGDLSVVAIATAVRDAILNRVLASNHDTSGTPGALLQAIATRATQASVDGVDTKAADLQAQVGTAGAGLTALRGAGTDTLESLATAVAGVSAGSAPTVEEIDAELTANHGAGLWTSAVTGSGDVYVTAATLDDDGDTMEFETSSGAGIGGASVKAFVKAEYDAGTFTVRGITTTADDGTWTDALLLNDGVQYTIEFSKDGYDTTTTTVTPSA